MMVKCWFCKEEMIWSNDFTFDEWGFEGEGLVAVLTCSGCGSEARFVQADSEELEAKGL